MSKEKVEKEYKLIPKPVPPRKGNKGGLYKSIVEDFMASKAPSALVEFNTPKSPPCASASFNHIRSCYNLPFKVSIREKEIYLVKAS
ncbi:MAG: hypothetical protein WC554_08470 [Clostridia bacterium]|jgi:hypothetical protein